MARKVLIVDDEGAVRRLIVAALSGGSNVLLQASGGLEALEVARRERPDVVLLDVQMPDLDGLEVCRRMRADPELRGAFVVVLTAQADARRRALEAGADDCVIKPFSPLQLARLVERRAP